MTTKLKLVVFKEHCLIKLFSINKSILSENIIRLPLMDFFPEPLNGAFPFSKQQNNIIMNI
jgi:hypothetical protein